MSDIALDANPLEEIEQQIEDGPPAEIGEDALGQLSEDGAHFITEEGHKYDLEGKLVREEAAPSEPPAQEPPAETPPSEPPAPLAPYLPVHVPMDYTDQEKQWLQAEMASLDAERMFAAQDYMAQKRANQTQQRILATQAMASDDPMEPLTRKYMQQAIDQYGNQVTVNPKQLRSWAELQAVSELGAARGDIEGELARYYAKKFSPAVPAAPPPPPAPRTAPPPVQRAVVPSTGPTPVRTMAQDDANSHVKMLQERFGISRWEAERAARETTRR